MMHVRVSIRLVALTFSCLALGVAGPPAGHSGGGHSSFGVATGRSSFGAPPIVRPLGTGSTGSFNHPIVNPILQPPSFQRTGQYYSGYNMYNRAGGRLPSRRPGSQRNGYRYGVQAYPLFLYGGAPFYGDPAYYGNGSYYDEPQEPGPDPSGALYDGSDAPSYGQPPIPYAPYPQPPAEQQPTVSAPVVIEPPITIVLRSGQKLRVDNYAVTNGLLWDFSKTPIRKIPVADIDLAASAQATEASGTDFPDLTSYDEGPLK